MPKLKIKTRSSAKKRFRVTATGKLRCQGAGFAHLRENKNKGALKEKMRLHEVDETSIPMLKCLLPNGIKGRKIRSTKKEN